MLRIKYFDILFERHSYLFSFHATPLLILFLFLCHFHPSQITCDPSHFSFIWTWHHLFCMGLKCILSMIFFVTIFKLLSNCLIAHNRIRSLKIRMQLPFGNYTYADWQGETSTIQRTLASFLAFVFVMECRWSRQDLSEQKISRSTMLRYGQKQQLNGVSSMCAKDKQRGKTN